MRGGKKRREEEEKGQEPRRGLKKNKKKRRRAAQDCTGAGLAGQRRRCEGLERGLYLDLAGGVNCGRPRGGSTLLIASTACGLCAEGWIECL